MAKIDWTAKFLRQLDANIGYASIEYGHATAIRWAEEIAAFENRVQKHPTSYTIES